MELHTQTQTWHSTPLTWVSLAWKSGVYLMQWLEEASLLVFFLKEIRFKISAAMEFNQIHSNQRVDCVPPTKFRLRQWTKPPVHFHQQTVDSTQNFRIWRTEMSSPVSYATLADDLFIKILHKKREMRQWNWLPWTLNSGRLVMRLAE